MKFLILPLLAAINYLDHNDPAWQSGPEIIYNVSFNAEALDETPKIPSIMVTNLTSQMKCRYQEPDYLNCHLSKFKELFTVNNQTHSETYVPGPESHEKPNDFTFGIKFNKLGIEKLIVSSSISPVSLDKLRYMVNQLHTGIILGPKIDGKYQHYENFTTGNCLTDYNVQLKDLMKHHTKEKAGKNKMWGTGIKVVIDKLRNIDNCKIAAPYFFESYESWLEEPRMKIKMKSSSSKIIADESTFLSTTVTTADLSMFKNPDKDILQLRENMTIIYDSVVPAKGEFPKIKDPASAGIIIGKWLYNDKSEEESHEVENRNENDKFIL